jgi:hypothetical protein
MLLLWLLAKPTGSFRGCMELKAHGMIGGQ